MVSPDVRAEPERAAPDGARGGGLENTLCAGRGRARLVARGARVLFEPAECGDGDAVEGHLEREVRDARL